MVQGATDKHSSTSRPDCLWPEIWSGTSKAAQREEKQHRVFEEPKVDKAGKLRWLKFHRSG